MMTSVGGRLGVRGWGGLLGGSLYPFSLPVDLYPWQEPVVFIPNPVLIIIYLKFAYSNEMQ